MSAEAPAPGSKTGVQTTVRVQARDPVPRHTRIGREITGDEELAIGLAHDAVDPGVRTRARVEAGIELPVRSKECQPPPIGPVVPGEIPSDEDPSIRKFKVSVDPSVGSIPHPIAGVGRVEGGIDAAWLLCAARDEQQATKHRGEHVQECAQVYGPGGDGVDHVIRFGTVHSWGQSNLHRVRTSITTSTTLAPRSISLRGIPCAVRWILAFVLLAVWCSGASAQAPRRYIFSVRHYGTSDGLPQRNINAIAQDHRGFIWLATPKGLARFDGYTFMNHTRANGLSMDEVENVVCDGDGLLWLLHPDGSVDILDPLTGACGPLEQHFAGRSPAPGDGPIFGIAASDNGIVAFHQEGHLMRYRTAKEGFTKTPLTCPIDPIPRRVEPNGDVWCFCNGREGAFMAELMQVGASGTDIITTVPDVRRVGNMGYDLWAGRPSKAQGLYLWRSSGQAWLLPDGSVSDMDDGGDTSVVNNLWQGIIRFELTDGIWLVNTTVRRMQAGDDPLKAPVLFDMAAEYPEPAISCMMYCAIVRGTYGLPGRSGCSS